MRAFKVNVRGIVQGGGFRPFVYRIAVKNELRGYVKNLGDAGVEIVIEGENENIEKFIGELRNEAPPLARVEKIRIEEEEIKNYPEFEILESSSHCGGGDSIIPPDVAICDECLRELFDPKDRRYMYPFIVCTNCGPRFSIIEALPYDRKNTSMADFPMCDDCMEEYTNPIDRRYHAEPISCSRCGPRYWLIDRDGKNKGSVKEAAKLIDEGYIIAVKGIGGFHLACDAENESVVEELRRRLRRKEQPFAIMASSLEKIRKFAQVSEEEEEELKSYRRPIVLLRKSPNFHLPESLAPGLNTIGVMLPYAGVHYILFHHSNSKVYVMTSANYPDFPMVKDNDKIDEIRDVADYFLLHNRRIVNRIDDSVVRFTHGRAVIRRSRGFVPLPIDIPFSHNILSMGAELMNTFSISRSGKIYSGQYIGNTGKIEVLKFLKDAIARMRSLLKAENLELIAVDSHPLYNSSKLGFEIGEGEDVEVLKVQHHYAHIASIMAEKKVDEIVGIAMDAVGYGLDGKTWGGEIITISSEGILRASHISYFPLPGGDMASYYPARSLAGLLYEVYGGDAEEIIKRFPRSISSLRYGEREMEIVFKQLEHGINVSYSSSTGRFLDGVSSLLDVSHHRSYEGEPAMKLEAMASRGKRDLNFEIKSGEEIEVSSLIPQILESRESAENIAYSVHLSIARAFADRAIRIAKEKGIKTIGASGGVCYNAIIMREMRRVIEKEGYIFLANNEIPRGDNGISAGQAYLAGMYLENMLKKNEVG